MLSTFLPQPRRIWGPAGEGSKAGVAAKYLAQQGPKFVEVVAKKSKALKENKKFTPAQVVTFLCILYAL
jgi:hypothetical protein